MRVDESLRGVLSVTHDSTRFSAWSFCATLVFLATAAYDLTLGARGDERLIGLLGAAATTTGIGLLVFERAHFLFDSVRRTVTWWRRWAWWSGTGAFAFESICDVRVEVPLGDDGVPSRRIVLRIEGARDLPVTAGYTPDADGAILRVAESIRAMIGVRPQESVPARVAALIDAGSVIAAIKLLRVESGMSLLEAKRVVDAARSRSE